ncbi:MAG: Ig-like domain-containing protein [Proteobacteria bacterium]|nr:Ig-like domain-containing protein [Pseudomonadota bacterium]
MNVLIVAGLVAAMPRGTTVPPVVPSIIPASTPHVGPSSRIIFMRRCPSSGCLITAGPIDDSRTNTSSIAERDTVIGPFSQGDAVWAGLMTCMRATYAPFDVTITDVDPGSTPHFEHVVGGQPSDLRSDIPNAGGVAPSTCTEIPNAITYTFDRYGNSSNYLCWTAAQETAHAFGLDHELLPTDPMTYIDGSLPKRFQPEAASCGESAPRQCSCTAGKQSSYETILALFGPGAPTPPTVTIRSPDAGLVQPHFVLRVDAMDDVEVARVELWIDGASTGVVATETPYRLTAPDGIAAGAHHVEARAYDIANTEAIAAIDVEMGPPCTAAAGCTDGDVCVLGVCIAGPSISGGLGDRCQANTECVDDQCVESADRTQVCVAACDGTAASCPSGFECLADAHVCWPTPDAGCCSSGGDPRGPIALSLGALALVVRRRRRS